MAALGLLIQILSISPTKSLPPEMLARLLKSYPLQDPASTSAGAATSLTQLKLINLVQSKQLKLPARDVLASLVDSLQACMKHGVPPARLSLDVRHPPKGVPQGRQMPFGPADSKRTPTPSTSTHMSNLDTPMGNFAAPPVVSTYKQPRRQRSSASLASSRSSVNESASRQKWQKSKSSDPYEVQLEAIRCIKLIAKVSGTGILTVNEGRKGATLKAVPESAR